MGEGYEEAGWFVRLFHFVALFFPYRLASSPRPSLPLFFVQEQQTDICCVFPFVRPGLSPPSLAVLASIKDLGERGIIEFNFEHIFFTYGEFAKAKLVGSGKPRFSRGIMREVSRSLRFLLSSSSSVPSRRDDATCFGELTPSLPLTSTLHFAINLRPSTTSSQPPSSSLPPRPPTSRSRPCRPRGWTL